MSSAANRLKEAWDKYKANNGPNKSKPVDDRIQSGDWEDKGWPDGSTAEETMSRRERILDAAADARARGVEPAKDPEFTRIVDEERRKFDPSYNPEQLAKLRKDQGGWEPTPEHLEHMKSLQAQMIVDATDREGRQYEVRDRQIDPVTGLQPGDNDNMPTSEDLAFTAVDVPDEMMNDTSSAEYGSTWLKMQDIPVGSKLDQEGIYTDRD